MSNNLFELASRKRIRFTSPKGDLSVEQLWDLPLLATGNQTNKVDLDTIARTIYLALKDQTEVSFVSTTPNNVTSELNLKMDIVRHIITVKQTEADDARKARERQAEIKMLEDALAGSKERELQSLTPAQLQERLNTLRAGN